ncbi:MAG: CoA transferase, partial [Alphaproteobacteria bacterium]
MSGLLDGVRVVDFTQVISGPYATYMLAQQGADVVKLELPAGGDQSRGMMATPGLLADAGQTAMFLSFNSGKRSIAVDLKAPEAKEIVADLVRGADVVIENFKAGAIDRLG